MKTKSKKSKAQAISKLRQTKKTITKRREKNKVQGIKHKKSKLITKRKNIEHKKLVFKEKMNNLKLKVQTGDVEAREEVERKMNELKETSNTNKKARKKLRSYKKILTNRNAFK